MLKAILILAAVSAFAQPPAFVAATIKPSKDEPGHSGWHSRTSMMNMTGQTLKGLICIAYRVKDYQVSGGPKWVSAERFDVSAKAEGAVEQAQMLPMLQTMLADRFQLVFHHEEKIAPAYALVLAKGGLKIKAAENPGESHSNGTKGKLTATGVTMATLAASFSRQVGAPVVDQTGTEGAFDFTLEWFSEGDKDDDLSAFFAALQSQLGLKMEMKKLPMDVIVVDKAEKPSEN